MLDSKKGDWYRNITLSDLIRVSVFPAQRLLLQLFDQVPFAGHVRFNIVRMFPRHALFEIGVNGCLVRMSQEVVTKGEVAVDRRIYLREDMDVGHQDTL